MYRAEYLAASMLFDADEGRKNLTLEKLHDAVRKADAADEGTDDVLVDLVRKYAQDRYDEIRFGRGLESLRGGRCR